METQIDTTTSQLPAVIDDAIVRSEPKTPTIETILVMAIERNISPESLEKLVALQERVSAKQAEQAFFEAMSGFRAECPIIQKTKTAENNGKRMYDYADLQEIAITVDPILHKFGLSYTFDFRLEGNLMTTTCTVHHVRGHSRSATFTCEVSGTSIMNSAQKAGSATTYGQRYSLKGALGLCMGYDDDGRKAAPMPQPDADPNAPKIPTRDERSKAEKTAQTGTVYILNGMAEDWYAKNPGKGFPDFVAFAKQHLRTELDMSKPKNWTTDCINAVRDAIKEMK